MTGADFLTRVRGRRVLVVGDLMLDRYLWGRVDRISPEAPVPVVDVLREESRLGGAANVALNLLSLGAQPLLCGAIGPDGAGQTLRALLHQHGLSDEGLLICADRPTTAKTRVLGNHQQMLRIDHEDRSPLAPDDAERLAHDVVSLMDRLQIEALIFEDYDKGVLQPALISAATLHATRRNVPVLVDPKHRNFFAYSHCTVFKPNVKELNTALGLQVAANDLAGLQAAVDGLQNRMPHQATVLTLSEHGVLVCRPGHEPRHIPAHIRQIRDVSGAGDTVVAVMAAALAGGVTVPEAAAVANLAGGLVCEVPGVVPIDPKRLTAEIDR